MEKSTVKAILWSISNFSKIELMPLTNGVFGASWTLPGRNMWRITKSVGVLNSLCYQILTDILCEPEGLKLFGHVTRADKYQDHSRALQACISPTPRNWRRCPGRPRHTWLRTVEEDLSQFNLGLVSGLWRVQNRTAWRTLTGTATSLTTSEWWWRWWWWWWWWWWWLIWRIAAILNLQKLL